MFLYIYIYILWWHQCYSYSPGVLSTLLSALSGCDLIQSEHHHESNLRHAQIASQQRNEDVIISFIYATAAHRPLVFEV